MQAGFPIVLKPHDDADLTEKKPGRLLPGRASLGGCPGNSEQFWFGMAAATGL